MKWQKKASMKQKFTNTEKPRTGMANDQYFVEIHFVGGLPNIFYAMESKLIVFTI